jgi:translation initiation factor IF-2
VEALCDSFERLSNDEIAVNIIRRGVGGIIEADIDLAAASDAIIIGFHVRANTQAKKMAEEKSIDIRLYQIIYDAIDDIQASIRGLQKPVFQEVSLGTATIKQVFRIKKVGVIAGCAVTKGVVTRLAKARVYRNDVQVYDGKVASLRHYESDVEEVRAGAECGITLDNLQDVKEGDIIEAYTLEEVKRKN